MNSINLFDLSGRVAVITGGAGLLGVQHAEIIAEAGGCPVLIDINEAEAIKYSRIISDNFKVDSIGIKTDIAVKIEVEAALETVLNRYDRIDILINNAANNPKVNAQGDNKTWSRFEVFSIENWNQDIAVGLTGAFLCSQIFGQEMAKRRSGVILNVSSDLGIIAPDQRIYSKDGQAEDTQPVKPVSYPVVKSALLGLTRYTATYWADKNIRANSISPGGVYTDQPKDFLDKLTQLIPMGRMANKDEYKAAVLFLVSDASSYMTGTNLVIDGGRSCW